MLTAQGLFTARPMLSNPGWFRDKLVRETSKPASFLNARRQPLRRREDICVFAPGRGTCNPQRSAGPAYDKGLRKDRLSGGYGDVRPARIRSAGSRLPTDVLQFKTAESEPDRRVWHPTQKPPAPARYLVRTFGNPGDAVLDSAFGSGSFLVAALLEGRRAIGIERNREGRLSRRGPVDFLAVAAARLRAAGAAPLRQRGG